MNLSFNINTDDTCGILVLDTTLYLPEELSGNDYKKSEVFAYLVIEDNKDDSIIDIATKNDLDLFIINNIKDGYYKVTMLLIPTLEYLESHEIDRSKINYCTDGSNIFKYIDELYVESSLEEAYMVYNSNINRINEDILNICHLKKCYILLCRDSIANIDRCYDNIQNPNFNRDLIWMTINIITYLSEFGLNEEAGKLINLIHGCNGICKSEYKESNKNECGCA